MAKEFLDLQSHIKKAEFKTIQEPEESAFHKFHEPPEVRELRRKHEIEIKQATEASYEIGYQNAMNEAREKYGKQLDRLQNIVDGMVTNIHNEKKKMAERTRDLFPEIIWQLIQMFFDEHARLMSETLQRRIQEALNTLLIQPGCKLYVNPMDVDLIEQNLEIPELAIKTIPDNDVKIASFKLSAGYAEIDGDVQTFLKKLKKMYNEK
ncbi:MAG: FliH/SctL family protein [Candidatus Zixiibacteriota bacterium]